MGFADELRQFHRKVETRERRVFAGIVDLAHESIVEGSPITGAPGQQVDTGALKGSWQKWYPSADEAIIATKKEYAPNEEDGISESGALIHQRSEVGGPHSVALTIAGFGKIVEHVTRDVVGADA